MECVGGNEMNYMKFALISVISLIVIGAAYVYLRPSHKAVVTILNNSSKVIKIVKIQLCGELGNAKNIRPKDTGQLILKVHRDCGYQVEVEFDSNETLNKQVGYVTNGLDFNDQIIVTDSDINMGNSSAH